MRPSDPIVDLAEQYQARFRETLGSVRRIGREAEFPLVWPDGRAGDASLLWAPLLEQGGLVPVREGRRLLIGARGPDVIYQAEVGKPTIELSLGPYDDLWELQRGLDQALGQLIRAAEQRGLWVLGYGIQPRSPPSSMLLTPRPHYQAFHQALGKPWLRLTTTAADQLHIDVSRSEILNSVNWMNLLSGPIIALCANSSVYAGRQGRYLSGREAFLSELGIHRHGMTPVRFEFIETLIRYLADYPVYVIPQDDGFRRVDMTFLHFADRELRRDPEALFKTFLWHEHYVWNSARPRVAHSTIEVRPACQQPPSELMAASALILGLVESLKEVQAYLKQALEPDPWPAMARYRKAAIQHGLSAKEPAPRMLSKLVDLARDGLAQRGRGEEHYLKPIHDRLSSGVSPAEGIRTSFRQGGMEELLRQVRIGPEQFEAHGHFD